MIFTYWTDDVSSEVNNAATQFLEAWSADFSDVMVFSDIDVSAILKEFGAEYLDLYRRIRIPACKSDIARLALIYRYGGMYVDIHSGPGDPRKIAMIFSRLANFEIIIADKVWEHKTEASVNLINGILCARENSPIVKNILESSMDNLTRHEKAEHETGAYVPYNLAVLCGAWNFRVNLYDPLPVADGVRLKKDLEGKIYKVDIQFRVDCGVVLYKFYTYRKEGRHWSERQKVELLFEPRSDVTTFADA